MSYDTLLFEVDAGLATVTLNRPNAGNAISTQMANELLDVSLKLTYDKSVRAVLLCGEGKVFCGGGDLAGFAAEDPEDLPGVIDGMTVPLHAAVARFAKMNAPLVAAVTGSCGGAGMSLIAACDIVIAGQGSKFTMGYTRAGLSPDGTSSFFLSRVVGLRRAMDLVLTNRVLSGTEAEAWGLVSRLVDDGDVLEAATKLARQLADGPTLAFGQAKRVILEGANSALEAAMERETQGIAFCAGTGDSREGMKAFLEKRPPEFKGL